MDGIDEPDFEEWRKRELDAFRANIPEDTEEGKTYLTLADAVERLEKHFPGADSTEESRRKYAIDLGRMYDVLPQFHYLASAMNQDQNLGWKYGALTKELEKRVQDLTDRFYDRKHASEQP